MIPLSFPHQPPRKTADALRAFQKEQTPKRRFDPEREFSANDRAAMLAQLEQHRTNGAWWHVAFLAADLTLLFPNHKDELSLGEPERKGIIEQLERYRTNKDWSSFVYLAASFTLLFPNHKDELHLGKSERTRIRAELEVHSANDGWWRFTPLAASFTLLFPNHKDELRIDDDTWEALRAACAHERDDSHENPYQWNGVARFAHNLHILSADHAAIDSNGRIQLSYDPMPFKKTPPLPARPYAASA